MLLRVRDLGGKNDDDDDDILYIQSLVHKTVIYISCDSEGQMGISCLSPWLPHGLLGQVLRRQTTLSTWSFIIKEVRPGHSHGGSRVPGEHFGMTS